MSGPARVPDSVGALDGRLAHSFFQVVQLARSAADFDIPVRANHRHTGGVITAVFQAPQAVEDKRNHLLGADVANNSAHDLVSGSSGEASNSGACSNKIQINTTRKRIRSRKV